MKIKILFLLLIITPGLLTCSDKKSPTENEDKDNYDIPGYKLVWQDEFSTSGLDMSKWEHEVNADGGGNNELQYYTDRIKNSFVETGMLIIAAHQEEYTADGKTRYYTSARLRTKNKGDWTYGRVEVKAKIPFGKGVWPAIWMLPTDWVYGGWPRSGEIDIMEHINLSDEIHGSVHTEAYNHRIGTQKTAQIKVPDAGENFHVYAVEWSNDKIDFFVDDNKYFTFYNDNKGDYTTWPFSKRFHLILNVAVGGDWPGDPDLTTTWPKEMTVDYVRVYEKE